MLRIGRDSREQNVMIFEWVIWLMAGLMVNFEQSTKNIKVQLLLNEF